LTTPSPEHLAHVKAARHALEQLLEAMDWPAEELAFHRAIDRLLQLEEEWSPQP
jgi:hypothetical protein